MAHARIVIAFIVIYILSEFVTACGGGGSNNGGGGGGNNNTVPGAPTIGTPTAGNAQISVAFTAPANNGGAVITNYTAACVSSTSGSSSGTASGASSPIVVTDLTNGDSYTCTVTATNSVGTGPASAASVAVTPTAPATVPGAPTNVIGTAGNASISVAFTAPANNGGAAITSYTATCSSTSSGSSSGTASGASSPIIVTNLTNNDPYTCTVTATNSIGTGPASAASAAVTPVLPNSTLTSISPALKWCVGECGIFPITLNGANFTTGQTVSCTPDPDIQSVTLNSSTQLTIVIAMDQVHEGSGYRQCKVCKSDGTGCTATVPFGLYGPNPCGVTPSGEKLCLNPQKTVAGQNLFNGIPQNGYVDKFKPITGAPDGKCFVGAPIWTIAVDDTTGWFGYGVNSTDPATCTTPLTTAQRSGQGASGTEMAVKAKNGFSCDLVPTALTCVSWLGGSSTTNPIMVSNFGTSDQSLAIGVTNSKTYAYAYDAGGQAIYKVDVSDGMTTVLSWSVTGITAGAPAGTEIVLFDSLGLGVLISYGDNLAIVFNESTLKQTGTIAVPSVPISMIAVGNVAVVGNLDGSFTKVDPLATATTIPSEETTFLPTGLVPAVAADGTGVDFYACPSDGTKCVSFAIP